MKYKALEDLRKAMGTLPELQPKRDDKIFIGVKGIRVELVDYPQNPYKAIYELVTSTWGGRKRWWKRWKNASVEGRISAVVAALQGFTLPQCLETPSFTFKIDGLSRSAYDQLARTRYSAIGSVGMRDNNWLDANFRLPSDLAANKSLKNLITLWWKLTKEIYSCIVNEGQKNWQSARCILPMGTIWRFTWSLNYRALKDMLAKRLMFCEQYDTVATAWLIRDAINEKFPLLASFLRPACDYAKQCVYHKTYMLSQAFGCLFKPCGRWPYPKKYYATFKNESAADPKEIREIVKSFPLPDDWDSIVETAIKKDKKYFEE